MSSSSDAPSQLDALRGLRSAPDLDASQRRSLRQELLAALQRCPWFTIGVMAPDRGTALACLRGLERALDWSPLQDEGDPDATGAADAPDAAVFLKGNQRTGGFRIRQESGLGEGLLITGHNPEDPACEDTWGPLPLDLFT
ncbi:MAG: DUF1824 family protein [Cyanobium sp.]